MDKIENYRNISEKILADHAAIPYAYDDIKNQPVFDCASDPYLLIDVGWKNKRFRVYGTLIHVENIDGKSWIQYDGMEERITTDLEAAGVPQSDIVLAWYELELRKYTEYAVA